MSQTDFNDLLVERGLKAVRSQLLSGIEREPVETDSSAPPDAVYDLPVNSLSAALHRFMLAMPDGKVWDSHKHQLVKKTAARDLMGKKLFDEWVNSPERRSVDQSVVKPVAAAAVAAGGGGLALALKRYVYLYPSTDAWDRDKRVRVPLSSLKHAIADCFDDWIKSDRRQEIDIENLVFDPTQKANLDTHINTFRGLPMLPENNNSKCDAICRLGEHLCNRDMEIYGWLLKWLAYPLQQVGSKMASAVLMHSHVQGSGKSLFFEEVVKPIYGEYASTLSQHQLESQYTDWRSEVLFGLFEEIFSRDQKYSHTGTLKHMITGKTQRIEKKFMAGWEEANFMNGVFLSNEVQPFPVEGSDRRMLVIWPEVKMPDDLKAAVLDEIRNGGVEAFYGFLLNIATADFTTHTEPPVTEAKKRLIEFGRPAWDVFYIEWQKGLVDVPFMPCLSDQIFAVYQRWCKRRFEHVVSQTKFSGFLATQTGIRRRRDMQYDKGQGKAKGVFFIPQQPDPLYVQGEDEKQAAWLGRCFTQFAHFMSPEG